MNVERIFGGGTDVYPYMYCIELSSDLSVRGNNRIEMLSWIRQTEFKCCLVETAIYVRDDRDASMFMLKWAS